MTVEERRTALPAPTRDLEEAKTDLETHGYCVVADALTPSETQAIRTRLVEQAAGERERGVATMDSGGFNQRVWMLINKGRVFREVALHPMARELMTQLLGDEFLLSSITANIAAKGGNPMVLHRDQGYITRPFPPYAMAANIMWMLDDFTEDNGATRLVPGSHLTEDGPPADDHPDTVAATGPAGSAMCFDGRLLHGTGTNTTPDPRHGILTYYCRPFIRQQENFTLSITDEALQDGGDELKALLGFKVWRTLGGVEGPREGTIVSRPAHPVGELRPE